MISLSCTLKVYINLIETVTVGFNLRILIRKYMTDRDLIKKLNNLREIAPDKTWLENNRALLYSQVSNSAAPKISIWSSFIINVKSFNSTVSMPALILVVILALVLVPTVFTNQLFGSVKPNQSLYIARLISEQARLSTTFNQKDRNRLAIQFAAEHAQAISNVLADPSFNNEANKSEVARLNSNFAQEMATVQTKLVALTPVANNTVVPKTTLTNANNSKNVKTGAPLKTNVAVANINSATDSLVFTANTGKDGAGISLDVAPVKKDLNQIKVATSSTETVVSNSAEIIPSSTQLINEATVSFNQKNWAKTNDVIDKILQANKGN